ncbi:hypothetical protein HOD05_00985 [Candidatus Woesearchaeota archaeon]|nr:hypothetical protein [Candidatus Woesearchaeota archaeon]MBT4150982.1 hypothetical protein [Candidatus Woesearchaeota archaeon]MBT4247254.1 hypothetical protein [Candidatus Woesearchaeota archaeon]MBT4433772.1 hypothetical protein [Candidatus Woesearchaeota archaeon]MBT7331895.1 hypothetical protein [Candidatus Woesearchaeota archaeon]
MAAVRYKMKCPKCRKNYVVVTRRQSFVRCYDCQKADMKGEIKDPKMKKMFKIPEEFYKENSFLRAIKVNYLRYESLSERQVEAFEKVVKQMKEDKKEAKKEEKKPTSSA